MNEREMRIKAHYKALIDVFIGEEYRDELCKLLEQKFDASVTIFNCDDTIQTGGYSDGTQFFESECKADALYYALTSDAEKIGVYAMDEIEVEESPDPSRPSLVWHLSVTIPLRGVKNDG